MHSSVNEVFHSFTRVKWFTEVGNEWTTHHWQLRKFVFIKHSTVNVRCFPSRTIVITENDIFFLPIALLRIVFCTDLLDNNFFKTVNNTRDPLQLSHYSFLNCQKWVVQVTFDRRFELWKQEKVDSGDMWGVLWVVDHFDTFLCQKFGNRCRVISRCIIM